jgi:hypothetical protein
VVRVSAVGGPAADRLLIASVDRARPERAAAPVARGRHERALRACEATLAVVRHDGDAVAEVQLAEACLRPALDAARTRKRFMRGR